jgi:hypothetical protein
MLCFVFPKVND